MIGVLTQQKPVLVEEPVRSPARSCARTRVDGADDVGARAQVRDLAQEFERVRLGLDRIRVGVLDASRSRRTRVACISNGWPFAGEGTTLPVASTAHPAVRCATSSA